MLNLRKFYVLGWTIAAMKDLGVATNLIHGFISFSAFKHDYLYIFYEYKVDECISSRLVCLI